MFDLCLSGKRWLWIGILCCLAPAGGARPLDTERVPAQVGAWDDFSDDLGSDFDLEGDLEGDLDFDAEAGSELDSGMDPGFGLEPDPFDEADSGASSGGLFGEDPLREEGPSTSSGNSILLPDSGLLGEALSEAERNRIQTRGLPSSADPALDGEEEFHPHEVLLALEDLQEELRVRGISTPLPPLTGFLFLQCWQAAGMSPEWVEEASRLVGIPPIPTEPELLAAGELEELDSGLDWGGLPDQGLEDSDSFSPRFPEAFEPAGRSLAALWRGARIGARSSLDLRLEPASSDAKDPFGSDESFPELDFDEPGSFSQGLEDDSGFGSEFGSEFDSDFDSEPGSGLGSEGWLGESNLDESALENETAPAKDASFGRPLVNFRLRRGFARAFQGLPSPSELRAFLSHPGIPAEKHQHALVGLLAARAGRSILLSAVASFPDRALEPAVAAAEEVQGPESERFLDALEERFGPSHPKLLQLRGRLAEARARSQEGLEESPRARDRRTREALSRVESALRDKNPELAFRLSLRAHREARHPLSGLRALAVSAYQLGHYQLAREALEARLAGGDLEDKVVLNTCKVLRRLGDNQALRQFLERALLRAPRTGLKVRITNELALEASIQGRGDEAERLARIGLGHFVPEKTRDNLWTRLAEAYLVQGKENLARKAYQKALSKDPAYRKAKLGSEALEAFARGSSGLGGLDP